MSNLSLRQKFILSVSLILAVGLGGTAYIEIHVNRRILTNTRELEAIRTSALIECALRQDMIEGRQSDIKAFLDTVREQREIEDVRIFDIEGRIRVSGGDDTGKMVDKMACMSCHPDGIDRPAQLDSKMNRRRFVTSTGKPVIGITRPIMNEPACFTAPCHVHDSAKKTLGILDVLVSLDQVESDVYINRLRIMAHSILTAIVVGVTLALLFQYLIARPLGRLRSAISSVEQGDLTARAEVKRNDELGQLAVSFNSMTEALESAHKKLEMQVEHADKLASVGEMMASIAHEIKSPLAGIATAAQVMLDGMNRDDAHREIMAEIIVQINRLHDTVMNLLQFARPRLPEPRDAKINDIIERIFFLINAQLRSQGIKIEKDYAADLPSVHVDSEQMQQAFLGLALNAIQAMPDGGTLRIATGTDSDRTHVTVHIEDTGCGIPEQDIDSIFGPFFTTKPNGTGLGLSIVHKTITTHHGTISVESEPGRGTRFIITIPAAEMSPADDKQEEQG